MSDLVVRENVAVTKPTDSFLALPLQQKIAMASVVATELKKIIKDQGLSKKIGPGEHVMVEGWNCMGALIGVLPRERENKRWDDGTWESFVDLINTETGKIVGGGSALCSPKERNWVNKDEFQVRSMAITRPTGKAYRMSFSWVMKMAGYEPTPVEEIDGEAKPPLIIKPKEEDKKTGQTPPEEITAKQQGMIFGSIKKREANGWSVDGFRVFIQEAYGTQSTTTLTKKQAQEAIDTILKRDFADVMEELRFENPTQAVKSSTQPMEIPFG